MVLELGLGHDLKLGAAMLLQKLNVFSNSRISFYLFAIVAKISGVPINTSKISIRFGKSERN